ncbi:MAG: NAD(P)-dependent oxidoreductase [Rubellimicrobium sp.]|nr:NAD(P)-dependent oxidoreductase [Rubellimicrobium sp.]
MITTLVTGTSGFVGSAIGRHLRGQGHHVIGLSRTPPRDGSTDRAIAHDLALPLPPHLTDALPPIDYVVHCAALSAPWGPPQAFDRNTLRPVETLARHFAKAPPRRFVHISTTAVHYRLADQTGLTEDSPLPPTPVNAYAAAKRAAEEVLTATDLPLTILRPRAVFGPGDTVVFPRILHAARAGLLPRLRRPDGGRAQSDLIHVDTLAAYVARALAADRDGTFILTNAAPVVTHDLLETVFAALGIPEPRREVGLGTAMLAARGFEWRSRLFQNWREPPVTRFGVSSLGHHKTFDIARTLAAFGPPAVSMQDGIASFIDWQRTQG